MKKIDTTVLKETKYILFWELALSVVMQLIFIAIGKWNYTVLLGNVLSGSMAVINFLLMGITVQNAIGKDEKSAKNSIRVSQLYRFFLLVVVVIIGVLLPCFNTWTVIIAIFFPRIAISFRPLFDKKQS